MKRRIVYIFCAVLLLGGACVYYINEVVLPTFVEKKIVSSISGITKGKVTLGKLRFNILRGLVANDLILFDKDEPEKELCRIKEASASFLILPFLKEKKIVVPYIRIDSLHLNLIRRPDNSFNISYIANTFNKPAENMRPAASLPALIVTSLDINGSEITFTDATFKAPVLVTLKLNDLLCGLSLNKINAQADIDLIKDAKKTKVSVKGSYFYASQDIIADIFAKNFDTTAYAPYISVWAPWLDTAFLTELKVVYAKVKNNSKINARFSIQGVNIHNEDMVLKDAKGDISAVIDAVGHDFKNAVYSGKLNCDYCLLGIKDPALANAKIEKSTFDYSFSGNIANITGIVNLSGIKAEKGALTLQNGSLESNASLTLPFGAQPEGKVPGFSFEGTAKIKSADISGIEIIGEVSDVTSSLSFKNSDVVIENTQFKALGSTITAQGKIKQNILDLDMSGILDLQKLPSLLPKGLKLPAFDISGTTDAKIHLTSGLTAATQPSISGEAKLENVGLDIPEKGLKFETESGRVKFDLAKQDIQLHIDAVKYLNETYSFDGSLKDFTTPVVNTVIIGKTLKIQSEFTKNGDIFQFASLKGQFKNSGLNINGQFDSSKEIIDMQGSAILDTSDIAGLKCEGKCVLDIDILGPAKDYKSWNAKIMGRSKALKYAGLTIKDVALNYSQGQREGIINSLSFDAYAGQGLVKGKINFLDDTFTYSAKGILQDIDLSLLKLDTPAKDSNFYGIAALNISVAGKDSDLNSIKGTGRFAIKNGNVGEFNPLKGLGNFLFISKFSNIVFTHAQGDFYISDGYATTNNLELLGPDIGLMAEGKISFDGTLDFLVNTQVSLPGPGAETISRAAGLTAIKLTGTVKEPKYKLQPIGENIMKKVGDIFSSILL